MFLQLFLCAMSFVNDIVDNYGAHHERRLVARLPHHCPVPVRGSQLLRRIFNDDGDDIYDDGEDILDDDDDGSDANDDDDRGCWSFPDETPVPSESVVSFVIDQHTLTLQKLAHQRTSTTILPVHHSIALIQTPAQKLCKSVGDLGEPLH